MGPTPEESIGVWSKDAADWLIIVDADVMDAVCCCS